ncbi:MAG: hypothetical protein HY926_08485 [Elusimicrobia bacterium]|nr:hypothetical protein [Elusimicrobiota bacterium]
MGEKAIEGAGLDGRLRELEERAALFEREAVSGAHLIAQLEATLRVNEQARRKLEALIARQSEELQARSQEAADLKRRLEAADKLLSERDRELADLERRYEEASRACAAETAERQRAEQETQGRIREVREAAQKELQAKMKHVMDCAEAVRREGIDALEEARALDPRRARAGPGPG